MHIDKILINNFKNYKAFKVDFSSGINYIFGENGAGKTNLLDAIYYLSLGKSAINTNDDENIRKKEFFFRIEGNYSNKNSYKCYYENKSGKKLFENDNLYKSLRKHIGKIPVVFVKPLDINLLRGYSLSRRKFFDTLISQTDEDYLNKLVDYNRLIKQRNSYLKNNYYFKDIDKDIIRTYNAKLIELNLFLSRVRKETSENFNKEFNEVSENLTKENFNIEYSTEIEEGLKHEDFNKKLEHDFYTKKTSLGIHNDDYIFYLDDRLIKRYGSQGQQKIFIISLKICEYQILMRKTEKNPIILLDDVYHKLDNKRIKLLNKYIEKDIFKQIFITDSVYERLKKIKKLKNINIIELSNEEKV
jgi:DNA replication and repair protein RecF